MLFALVATLALLVGGSLWLAGELAPAVKPPRLRTVELGALLESALDAAREAAAPPAPEPTAPAPAAPPAPSPEPEVEEEVVSEPEPFVEAPLPAPNERPDPVEAPPADAGPVVVAARDQDAWGRLIRRMLALYERTEER